MNAWQVLEAKFKQAFVDYAIHEWAQDELQKLKMKEGNIDEYIVQFASLVHQAGMDVTGMTMHLPCFSLPYHASLLPTV